MCENHSGGWNIERIVWNSKVVQLKAFEKFSSTTQALSAAAAIVDSKLEKGRKAVEILISSGIPGVQLLCSVFVVDPGDKNCVVSMIGSMLTGGLKGQPCAECQSD